VPKKTEPKKDLKDLSIDELEVLAGKKGLSKEELIARLSK